MRFTATDERKLIGSEHAAMTILARDPAVPVDDDKDLTEAGLVGADSATGLELDHVHVGVSVAAREAGALGQGAVVLLDRRHGRGAGSEHLHGPARSVGAGTVGGDDRSARGTGRPRT